MNIVFLIYFGREGQSGMIRNSLEKGVDIASIGMALFIKNMKNVEILRPPLMWSIGRIR